MLISLNVEKLYNPYQGLKPWANLESYSRSLVEKPYNPYQGLKRIKVRHFHGWWMVEKGLEVGSRLWKSQRINRI